MISVLKLLQKEKQSTFKTTEIIKKEKLNNFMSGQ